MSVGVRIPPHKTNHVLSEAGIDIWIDLGDPPVSVNRNNRRLMIFQFGKGRHCGELLRFTNNSLLSNRCDS
jgi:hypothetical protein